MKKIKMAHIGWLSNDCGADCMTTAWCDINKEKMAENAKKHPEIEMYTDYREMIAKADFDAVVIATPNFVHAEQAIAFLKAGKHVFLEKPMGITKGESDAILKSAEESGKVLAVDFELRISTFSRRIKKFIEGGEYGALKRIEFIHHRGSWLNEGNGIWRVIPEKSGGMYFMEPVHEVDIFRFFGGEIDSVQTTVGPNVLPHYKFQDNLCSHFFFSSGALGTILTTHTHSAQTGNPAYQNSTLGHDMSMILTFAGGSVSTDFLNCTFLFNRFEEYPAGSGALRVIFQRREDYSPDGGMKFCHDISAMRKEFIRRIACGEPPMQDALDAWKSHQVCLAAEQSAKEDFRRVKVDYKR